MLDFHAVTETEKKIISEWKYPGEYSIYNNISYDEQIRTGRGFANPENNHYSFYDGEVLVGFINLREVDNYVHFGIGVAPDLCGQGYGQQIASMACELASEIYPGKEVCLEVRTWNKRAIRCYEKAGFRIVGEPITKTTPIGTGQFYKMMYDRGSKNNDGKKGIHLC